jgi:hypothetical protein
MRRASLDARREHAVERVNCKRKASIYTRSSFHFCVVY